MKRLIKKLGRWFVMREVRAFSRDLMDGAKTDQEKQRLCAVLDKADEKNLPNLVAHAAEVWQIPMAKMTAVEGAQNLVRVAVKDEWWRSLLTDMIVEFQKPFNKE